MSFGKDLSSIPVEGENKTAERGASPPLIDCVEKKVNENYDNLIREEQPKVNVKTEISSGSEEDDDFEDPFPMIQVDVKIEEEEDDDEGNNACSESDLDESDDEDDILNYCKVCKTTFDCDEDYREHYRQIAVSINSKGLACCSCRKCFRDLTQLKVHQRKHTGEKPYSCDICKKRFSINGNLTKHKITHTGERRFECDTCDKKFSQFAHLEDHMRTHSGDKPFECDHCDTAFKTKARLRKHMKSHDPTGNAKRRNMHCEICNKRFTFFQLEAHMRRHKDIDRSFKCPQCDIQLKTYNCLQSHMKTAHSDLKNYICHICQKKFSTGTHLSRHVKTHSGIKPYICEICMRGFPCSQNLKRHLQVHRGEKPFRCETCQKAFLTLENLKRHIRTHTKEKPYSCTVCHKLFAHSTTVKEHMLTHTGERPFGCRICNKQFSLNKMLYRHIRQKHPQQLEECDIKDIVVKAGDVGKLIRDIKEGDEVEPNFIAVKCEIKEEPNEVFIVN